MVYVARVLTQHYLYNNAVSLLHTVRGAAAAAGVCRGWQFGGCDDLFQPYEGAASCAALSHSTLQEVGPISLKSS